MEITAPYFEITAEHINIFSGQNAELNFNVRPRGT